MFVLHTFEVSVTQQEVYTYDANCFKLPDFLIKNILALNYVSYWMRCSSRCLNGHLKSPALVNDGEVLWSSFEIPYYTLRYLQSSFFFLFLGAFESSQHLRSWHDDTKSVLIPGWRHTQQTAKRRRDSRFQQLKSSWLAQQMFIST